MIGRTLLGMYLLSLSVFAAAVALGVSLLSKRANSWPAASLEGRQGNALACHTNTGHFARGLEGNYYEKKVLLKVE